MDPDDQREALAPYRAKRDFSRTDEPAGAPEGAAPSGPADVALPEGVETGAFVVQEHDARRLHYDFRLEVDGVLKSWAVPRGPSTDPNAKRLAVPTEDHPLEYGGYEGVIPEGGYGAGPSLLWDRGTYINLSHDRTGAPVPMTAALAKGHLSVWLRGEKLVGGWSLTRIENSRDGKEAWLLVKRADAAADPDSDITVQRPRSVLSGLTLDDLRRRGR
ncbi:MAG TPA: DNA polymerase ligase N-terminal domain-containing protein [Acidimicrobiales bacterium]|nr:DNA polymerase ligase N-terminal domain-containing protein [Acidimicrobiales bacterium]